MVAAATLPVSPIFCTVGVVAGRVGGGRGVCCPPSPHEHCSHPRRTESKIGRKKPTNANHERTHDDQHRPLRLWHRGAGVWKHLSANRAELEARLG